MIIKWKVRQFQLTKSPTHNCNFCTWSTSLLLIYSRKQISYLWGKGRKKKTRPQMMSGGFLMFSKIVSEMGFVLQNASILSDRHELPTACKHRLSVPAMALWDWMLHPLAGIRPIPTTAENKASRQFQMSVLENISWRT